MAAVRLSCLARNGATAPGEESRSVRRCVSGDRGAAVLRPDQAMERPCGPHAEQHPREKTWRTSNAAHKRPGFPGEEKETLAFRKDGVTTRQSVQTATLPMERVSVGLDDAWPTRALQRRPRRSRSRGRAVIHRTEIQPLDDEDGAGSPVPGRARQWKRCRTSRAPPIDIRRDKQRHARPGRAADKDSADNREGLAPDLRTARRYAASPNVAW